MHEHRRPMCLDGPYVLSGGELAARWFDAVLRKLREPRPRDRAVRSPLHDGSRGPLYPIHTPIRCRCHTVPEILASATTPRSEWRSLAAASVPASFATMPPRATPLGLSRLFMSESFKTSSALSSTVPAFPPASRACPLPVVEGTRRRTTSSPRDQAQVHGVRETFTVRKQSWSGVERSPRALPKIGGSRWRPAATRPRSFPTCATASPRARRSERRWTGPSRNTPDRGRDARDDAPRPCEETVPTRGRQEAEAAQTAGGSLQRSLPGPSEEGPVRTPRPSRRGVHEPAEEPGERSAN